MISEDILLLHHKMDIIIRILSKHGGDPLSIIKGTTFTNTSCPLCNQAVEIRYNMKTGEIRRHCGCIDALGIRSTTPIDFKETPVPPAWGKNYED
jgi:hypothetical protein